MAILFRKYKEFQFCFYIIDLNLVYDYLPNPKTIFYDSYKYMYMFIQLYVYIVISLNHSFTWTVTLYTGSEFSFTNGGRGCR